MIPSHIIPMPPVQLITPLFAVALALGLAANVLYFWVRWRVSSVGLPVPWFITMADVLRLMRKYKEIAAERRWIPWLPLVFWILTMSAFGVAIIAIVFQV